MNGAVSKESSRADPPSTLARSPRPARVQSDTGNDKNKTQEKLTYTAASDKQKLLLSTDSGHFSLIRALHLADLITELNGESRLRGFWCKREPGSN